MLEGKFLVGLVDGKKDSSRLMLAIPERYRPDRMVIEDSSFLRFLERMRPLEQYDLLIIHLRDCDNMSLRERDNRIRGILKGGKTKVVALVHMDDLTKKDNTYLLTDSSENPVRIPLYTTMSIGAGKIAYEMIIREIIEKELKLK